MALIFYVIFFYKLFHLQEVSGPTNPNIIPVENIKREVDVEMGGPGQPLPPGEDRL